MSRGMRAAAVFALGVLACAPQPGPADRATAAQPSGDSLVAALHAFGRSFGESRATIERQLGAPRRIQTEALPNRHVAGAIDTAIAFWYSDAVFGLLRSGATGREFLVGAEIWQTPRELPGGVRIGTTARGWTETTLGAPVETRADGDTTTLVYFWPPDGAEEAVQLRFVRDTLRAIRWGFYVD
jgi:hypothetical protein